MATLSRVSYFLSAFVSVLAAIVAVWRQLSGPTGNHSSDPSTASEPATARTHGAGRAELRQDD